MIFDAGAIESFVQQSWSVILQLGSLSGLMLLLYKIVFERQRVKVRIEGLTMLHDTKDSTEPGLRVNMRVRNRGPGSTSIESVCFVTNLLTLKNFKLTDRPTLVSEKVGETIKQEILRPTNLPVRIGGGTTRRYEVEFAPSISVRSLNIFGSKWVPRRLRRLRKHFAKEHNLFVETTHKTFRVRLGWSQLTEGDEAILRETHPFLFSDEPS